MSKLSELCDEILQPLAEGYERYPILVEAIRECQKVARAALVMEHQLIGFRNGLWLGEIRRQANLTLREVESILEEK